MYDSVLADGVAASEAFFDRAMTIVTVIFQKSLNAAGPLFVGVGTNFDTASVAEAWAVNRAFDHKFSALQFPFSELSNYQAEALPLPAPKASPGDVAHSEDMARVPLKTLVAHGIEKELLLRFAERLVASMAADRLQACHVTAAMEERKSLMEF